MSGRSPRDRRQRRRAPARRRAAALAAGASRWWSACCFPVRRSATRSSRTRPRTRARRSTSRPGHVQFDFNEPVEVTSGSIRLFDDEGAELSAGAPAHPGGQAEKVAVDVPAELAEGVYTATYRVDLGRRPPGLGWLLLRRPRPGAHRGPHGARRRRSARPLRLAARPRDRLRSRPRAPLPGACCSSSGPCFFRALVWPRGSGDARWPTGMLFAAAFARPRRLAGGRRVPGRARGGRRAGRALRPAT